MDQNLQVREVEVKSIITESRLPDADYVINPYVGCQHACVYCYAEFMKRFTGHKEPWGDFVDVKINALDALGNIEKIRGKKVLMSSVTDPYHPLEAKYKITRKILGALVSAQPRMEILTKGRMVVRDIDLLKQYEDCTIGISISTLDDSVSRELEPLTAAPLARIEAIKRCKEAGLKTYVFLSPIFPYITNVREIIESCASYVDYFMFENLNLRPSNLGKIYKFLEKNNPDLVSKYREIYEGKDNNYWDNLLEEITDLCGQHNKEARIYFHHGGFKKQNA